jgi:hypothetical protein
MVMSHTFGGACYDHMTYAGGAAPLAETLCPVVNAGAAWVSPLQATLETTLAGMSGTLQTMASAQA